jgi:RimJ/RimL family protein N-acetyltransferase
MADLPETISAAPLVLRRSRVADAGALAAAVGESLEHLAPWLAWATPDAATVAAQTARLSSGTWGPDLYDFVMETGPGLVVGACGLRRHDAPGTVAIGYWVHVRHVRHGYARTAAEGLTRTALALPGIRRVEIHCDEANVASVAIPRRLGYVLDRVEERAAEAPQTGRLMVWGMDRPSR